jgi:hypothetical protein
VVVAVEAVEGIGDVLGGEILGDHGQSFLCAELTGRFRPPRPRPS